MMWTSVASSILLVLTLAVDPTSSEGDVSSGESPMDRRISKFKADVHRIFEGARIRAKRQLEGSDPLVHKYTFGKVTPADLPYLAGLDVSTWLSIVELNQVLIGTADGRILLYQVQDADMNAEAVAWTVDEGTVVVKAMAFTYNSDQWFVVLHRRGDGFYIKIYQRNGRDLVERQIIHLIGSTDMELTTVKGKHYLAIAKYNSPAVQGFTYRANLTLYHWASTQFDVIAWRTTFGARSVVCWNFEGSLYVAVGQEINDHENKKVGSPVYFYSSMHNSKEEKKLRLVQTLATYGPTKVRHFSVAENHYVVFIGRQDAVIYWWLNDQFLEWQTLQSTANALDVSILSMGGEVAIVIVLQEAVLFYTLDTSGLYVVTFSMSLEGFKHLSLQFMLGGGFYYALALSDGSQAHTIWRLEMKSHYLPKLGSLDPLEQCLEDTQQKFAERQSVLKPVKLDLDRVWRKEDNQTVSTKVTVQGRILSKEPRVKNVIIIRVPNIPVSSFYSVRTTLALLRDALERSRGELQNEVVFKSPPQEIRGAKRFKDGVVVPSLRMESTDNDITINEVRISRLSQYALRKVGDQEIPFTIVASNIYAGRVNVGAINGISTSDLLLLHGRQFVTGNLVFHDGSAFNIYVDTINSIPVQDIVTTASDQTIKDLKSFSHLKSYSIHVEQETNGVELSGILPTVARIDKYNEFSGHLTFQDPVVITGSLFLTRKLNKVVDIPRLVTRSVSKGSQQDLSGFYTFSSGPIINRDLLVSGSINGVSTDHLLTIHSNQKIFADMGFSEELTVAQNLIVDSVNGVDLSEQVVQKIPHRQFISGRKIFEDDIVARTVDMSDYTTLDGVDPSFLVQYTIQHIQGVVHHNLTNFPNVKVLGSLTALSGINGFDIMDLPSRVWLKSTEQTISVAVKAHVLRSLNDLEVTTVNNFIMEDFVSTYKPEVMESLSFHSKITLETLSTSGDISINGIRPTSLKIELERYTDEGIIHGEKTIEHLQIIGNVEVAKLNGLDLSAILYRNASQIVKGKVEFTSKVTPVQGNVNSNSISFGWFNGLDLHDYFKGLTLTRPVVVKNKHFNLLKASHLIIHPGNTLAGEPLPEMMRRVVTLNTPQLIPESQTFHAPTVFSKLISVFTMNGLQLSNFLGKVVLADETSEISNKRFLGNVQTTTAFVAGEINGVNVQNLAANTFFKSGNNEVSKHFIFDGDVDVGDLSAPVVDGVPWGDLIFLGNDEVLPAGWFLSNLHANQDIFITGRLNGCDLSQIGSSLYANQTMQVINKRINVHTIAILGNVVIEKTINQISLDILRNFITTTGDQVISSNIVIEDDMTVEDLISTGFVDSANIAFIMQDSVRNSWPQEITGLKDFKELVNVTVLAGGDVFATSVNGIDLEELVQSSVSKTGHHEITGDKIFPSLFADVVTISGFLNGLNLPHDVVKTDESEIIEHPTYFMSDVYVPSGLMVHGLIDGVDLEKLLKYRVTLNSRQKLAAKLFFYDDVYVRGELIVDGTINEMVLDLVTKTKSSHPLQGYKVFVEFYVDGSLSAPSVNGFNIPQLDSRILRYNRDDYVNAVQTFYKIDVQNSLYAEWINGVPINWLKDTFTTMLSNVRPVLGYLENLSSSLQQKLINQLSAVQGPLSKFAYFVLHQEIKGSAIKLLRGYDFHDGVFSHSIVMWTKEKHCIFMEKCCHLEFSYWLRVKKDGYAMVDRAAEAGRFYPILDSSPPYDKDFFIWTNSTDGQPKSCNNENTKMFLGSYNGEHSLDLSLHAESSPQLSDVKSFRRGNLYAVAAYYFDFMHEEYGSTIVYVYDEMKHWYEHQVLPSFGILSMDIISHTLDYRNDLLLALGSGMKVEPTSYSTVYRWNSMNRGFEELQKIPSRYVTSTLWIRKDDDLLLSLAGVDVWPNKATDCSELVSGGQIDIYLFKEKFEWIQSIPVGGVVSTATFSTDGDTYLAAASVQEHAVYIFQWKGYSGFVEIQTLSIDAQHLSVYSIDDDTYMTVASMYGPSKILKMVRTGKSSPSVMGYEHGPLEQKDGVPPRDANANGC